MKSRGCVGRRTAQPGRMHTPARFVVCAAVLVASFAHAEKLEFSEGAASAYVDLMAFIVSQAHGTDAKLTKQQKSDLVADVRARWTKGEEAWKRRVLDSPRLFVELLKAWRGADEAARDQMRRKWAEQLAPKKTDQEAKQLTPVQQMQLMQAQKMAYESRSNVSRAYHEMSMTAISNINSDKTWTYEYRRR